MISLESMRRIEDICSSFERNSKLGGEVVDSLLDQVDAAEQTSLTSELIALDAELRWRAGESPSAADYRKVLERPGVHLTEPQLEQLIENAKSFAVDSSDQPAETARYQFLERIGRGAYGDVWRANDKVGCRPLAVKVLRKSLLDDPNAGARLLREALLTGQLQHPGIPPVHDYGTLDDGSAYYAMKLVGGRTFESILSERAAEDLQVPRALSIFHSVAQTVAYAHSAGIIHRDLKPHNVMVGDFGEVQVMDWGMAKSLSEVDDEPLSNPPPELTSAGPAQTAASRAHSIRLFDDLDTQQSLTTDGDVLGTPAYMSPEQARGEKESLDARSDVFSLGAILYQILTTKRLHQEHSSREAIRRRAAGDQLEAFTELDKTSTNSDLIVLCRRCLAASPGDRPDANQICRALSDHFLQVEQRVRQAEIERREMFVRQSETTRRRRVQLLAASAVTIVSVMGLTAALWQRNQAIEAQQQVSAALELADQRLEQAQDVVDDFFVEISNEQGPLARAPGSQKVRRELTEKAQDYYAGFLSESGDDPRLQLKIAKTYVRLADILHLVSPGEKLQEDYLLKAIDICNKRLQHEAFDADALEFKASAQQLLGRHYQLLEQFETASQYGQAAIESVQLLAEAKNGPNERFSVAKYMQSQSSTLWRMGQYQPAAELCQAAIEIGSAIQQAHPDDVNYAHQLSRMHTTMGNLLAFSLGKRDLGKQQYERAIECSERAQQLEPTRPDIKIDLAMQQMNLAMVLTHEKKYDEAKERFEGAAAVLRVIVEQNPDVPDYREDLAHNLGNFSTFCQRYIMRPDLAERALFEEAEHYRQLMRSAPNVDSYVGEAVRSLISWTGTDYLLQTRASEALVDPKVFAAKGIEEIRALKLELAQRSPEKLSYRRSYEYWLLLEPGADPQPLLKLTEEVDPNHPSEADLLYHATALIRADRHDEATELLAASLPEKPSLQRTLLAILACIPSDPEQAGVDLKKAEDRLLRMDDNALDECILYYEAKSKLDAGQSPAS